MKKPPWLNKKVNLSLCRNLKILFKDLGLYTVCQEARCPNISECFSKGVATFMILGNICTRNCRFCAITKGIPKKVNFKEPELVKTAVEKLKLSYVVITSPTRDDLPDGGATLFYLTVKELKTIPSLKVEVLIPDFGGNLSSLEEVLKAYPDVVSHNIETVASLYPYLRSKADYTRSLRVLRFIKDFDKRIFTKSGIMLGLGEKDEEVEKTLKDLREAKCDFLSIGQYLPPSRDSWTLKEYVPIQKFFYWERVALKMGFKKVLSSPYVRSSYLAHTYTLTYEGNA